MATKFLGIQPSDIGLESNPTVNFRVCSDPQFGNLTGIAEAIMLSIATKFSSRRRLTESDGRKLVDCQLLDPISCARNLLTAGICKPIKNSGGEESWGLSIPIGPAANLYSTMMVMWLPDFLSLFEEQLKNSEIMGIYGAGVITGPLLTRYLERWFFWRQYQNSLDDIKHLPFKFNLGGIGGAEFNALVRMNGCTFPLLLIFLNLLSCP